MAYMDYMLSWKTIMLLQVDNLSLFNTHDCFLVALLDSHPIFKPLSLRRSGNDIDAFRINLVKLFDRLLYFWFRLFFVLFRFESPLVGKWPAVVLNVAKGNETTCLNAHSDLVLCSKSPPTLILVCVFLSPL